MKHRDLPIRNISTDILLRELAEGWDPAHSGVIQEFMYRWETCLRSHVDVEATHPDTASFVTYLSGIRLRTMDQVPCCLLGGESDLSDAIWEFWKENNVPTFLPFFLALSGATFDQVRTRLPTQRFLLLSFEQIKEILVTPKPLEHLKLIILQQIPRRALIPYDILRPVEGSMFFGRSMELERLSDDDFTSFAITGAGRIGKSSLLREYWRHMWRTSNRRAARFVVNFYKSELDEGAIARFLAMEIQPSRRSHRMTPSGLVNFLRHMRSVFGRPIELLLDEVDEVCHGESFRYLGEAAKMGLCRLVLSGRGVLLKMMLKPDSPLECRMDLMGIGPLSEAAGVRLLTEPLAELGFTIDQPEQLAERVLSLTGGLPHLIQMFGKRLAESAIIENSNIIGVEHLEKLKDDFLTAQFFIRSLVNLDDHRTRLTGLALVVESNSRNFTVQQVQEIGNREGLSLDFNAAHEICIDLMINNVLTWSGGSYTLANEGIRFYAERVGYLTAALHEARQHSSLGGRA